MKNNVLRLYIFAILMMAMCSGQAMKPIEYCADDNEPFSLPRAEADAAFSSAFSQFLDDFEKKGMDLHSVMVLKDGKVIAERWMNEGSPEKPHVLWSVSKTFNATAVGFAVAEHKLHLTDKVVSFFKEELPETISENLGRMTVRDLLTMTCGSAKEPTAVMRNKICKTQDTSCDGWAQAFFAIPVTHKPGTFFKYNSMASYMLSAIVQKVTGQKVVDYLTPRLFEPLGFFDVKWDESPFGVNTGGWGLYLRTEDMAKLGQLFLQKGKWNGKQIIPADWIMAASSKQVNSIPGNYFITDDRKDDAAENDWFQGYGFQMWRSRHNSFRADGMRGQFILVLPEKNAVVAMTANIAQMPDELNLVWKYLLPLL